MGVTIRSTVKKAAKLAVYEEMRINVKNHQTAPTIRPDIDLEFKSPFKYKGNDIGTTRNKKISERDK